MRVRHGSRIRKRHKETVADFLAFLFGNPPHVILEVQCLSLGKCEETVSAVCSGLHVLPLFKGVWGRHPTPIDPAYYNSCGPAPHLSSECLSLLQRLQLNINPTTAGEAIKREGVIFQKGTPNKDEDNIGRISERALGKKMELPRQLSPLSRSRSFFSKRIETALSDLHWLDCNCRYCGSQRGAAWPKTDLDK